MKFWSILNLLAVNPKRFFVRVQQKFLAPSNWLVLNLRRIYCMLVPNRSILSNCNNDRLLFVYDTLLNPVTFDFLDYLYYAIFLSRQTSKKYVDILIVSRSNMELSREEHYIAAVGSDNIEWRLTNLIIPLSRLFPSVGRIYMLDQEEGFEIVKRYPNVHPEGYSYITPKTAAVRRDDPNLQYYPTLKVCDTAKKIVEAYFPLTDKRRIVTITLRTYDYIPSRNSNIACWVDFANELDPLKYRIVFVPDASMHGVASIDEIKNFEIFDSACWNIELRAALYQRAWMNMGVACGPLAISGFMEPVLTIMIDRSLDYPVDYLEGIVSSGITPGETPNFYSSSCRFYLGQDNKETILKLFNEYVD
jgi:hypothetical protein